MRVLKALLDSISQKRNFCDGLGGFRFWILPTEKNEYLYETQQGSFWLALLASTTQK